MKVKHKILFSVICFVLAGNIARAQDMDSIQYILDSTYARSPFFGNILITQHNNIVFEKSYGYADALTQRPLTKNHSFQLASISKQFTAYGIMILQTKGLLNYDSLVCKYIPSFPYKEITIRHLLNHTSGLPNFWDNIRPNLDTLKPNGNREVLEYLIQHRLPLQFEPGTTFQYADIGYDFLANIIETVSGLSYQEFMYQNIFKPLKMKNTFAYMVTDIRNIDNQNLAIGHTYANGTFAYAHLQPQYHFVYYLGNFYGDGSVVSSARDLAIWSKALKACTLLPCEIQQESVTETLFKGQTVYTNPNRDMSYGFGWFIKNTPSGKLIYHSGGHPGNTHILYRLPDKDIIFIFLSNAETSNTRALRNRILKMLQ